MSQDVLPSDPSNPSPSDGSPLVVGLDLGGTKMAAALVDVNGALQGPVASCPTPAHDGPIAMLDAVSSLVHKVAESGTHHDPGRAVPIAAVGIGTAGVVDVEHGTILSATDAITGWAGTRVATGVQERLAAAGLGTLPVHVENDVDAYAAGEAWLGAGTGAEVVLMVAVGTGVGGALVIEGATRRGAHHVAGEIGHVPVPGAQGEPCTCGRPGHLEGIAAGPQIHRRYLAKGGDPDVPDAREVERRAAAGDDIAQEVYRDSAACLGRALAGLVTVIDPDVVVVSGGLARAGDLWWEPLRQTFAAEVIDPLTPIRIVPATLGTTAPIVGAARGALALAGEHD
ncbi:ROK family protein [Actinomyces sp. ZJ308]|uniref:ROK family protein n=1 Tax=Actinomyces sp. ZJ308 TaxID=2708342 RepID=UPI001422E25B|nr:ROK family protein [Actinomyces sp. ZJ308]